VTTGAATTGAGTTGAGTTGAGTTGAGTTGAGTTGAASGTTGSTVEETGTTKAAGNDTFVAANTNDQMKIPCEVTMSVNATLVESCAGAVDVANTVLLGVTITVLQEVSARGLAITCMCPSDLSSDLPATCSSRCFDRKAPGVDGASGISGATFNAETKNYQRKSCDRRRLSRRRLADASVKISDEPTLVYDSGYAAVATELETVLKAPATQTQLNTKVQENTKKVADAISSGDPTFFQNAGLPAVVTGGNAVAATVGHVMGTDDTAVLSTVTASDFSAAVPAETKAAASATSAAGVTAKVSDPVPVAAGSSSTTSGAAEVFLSAIALVGAAVMW